MSFSLSAFRGQVFALAGEPATGLHPRAAGDLTAAA